MFYNLLINQAPLFHEYFYNFVKENVDNSCTMEFLSENFIITNICECPQSGCSTVYLKSKLPLPHFEKIITNHGIKQRIHLDEDNYVREFELVKNNEKMAYYTEIVTLIKEMTK